MMKSILYALVFICVGSLSVHSVGIPLHINPFQNFFKGNVIRVLDGDTKGLGAALDRTTPAEIKEIINIAIGMIRGTKNELSTKIIKDARSYLKGTLDLCVLEADEDIDTREGIYKENGPQPDYTSYLDE